MVRNHRLPSAIQNAATLMIPISNSSLHRACAKKPRRQLISCVEALEELLLAARQDIEQRDMVRAFVH
jgi:hypothetical protein